MSLFFRLASLLNVAKEAKTSLQNARDSARRLQTAARDAQATVVNRSLAKAEQGNAAAQFDMGERCYEGLGVPQDYAAAAQWFHLAAAQGHAQAQCNLGMMCFLGRGVGRDYVEAYQWIELAARQGYAGARKAREAARKRMTPEQIEEGERRVAALMQKPRGVGQGTA